jgi:hypothetical protein
VYLFLWLMYVSDGSFLFIFGLSVAVMVFEIVGWADDETAIYWLAQASSPRFRPSKIRYY